MAGLVEIGQSWSKADEIEERKEEVGIPAKVEYILKGDTEKYEAGQFRV